MSDEAYGKGIRLCVGISGAEDCVVGAVVGLGAMVGLVVKD